MLERGRRERGREREKESLSFYFFTFCKNIWNYFFLYIFNCPRTNFISKICFYALWTFVFILFENR